MVFDDIVIGSGLTALATVAGLAPGRRVLVIAAPREGKAHYYDSTQGVPRSFDGFGGLGNYWHGVIPTATHAPFAQGLHEEIAALFRHFYPRSEIAPRLGQPWLFIPRRPIRPAREWPRLAEAKKNRLQIEFENAIAFEQGDGGIVVRTAGDRHRANRLWIAAGVFATPKLLEASLAMPLHRGKASDHIICYKGQLDRAKHPHIPAPVLERAPEGFWMKVELSANGEALLTTKPARFDYRRLDHGFEQRRAFGLRTSGAVSKIARAGSLGLISEAVFNRYGLFGDSPMLSVYAQVLVRDAYEVDPGDGFLRHSQDKAACEIKAATTPWPEITETRRPDLFLQGIHLHHTIDMDVLNGTGIGKGGCPVRIVDPSVLDDIGPEHHSFYAMARAFGAAREASI